MKTPIEQCIKCRSCNASDEVEWNCLPVPRFGNLQSEKVKVVTVGINPAWNEFVNHEKMFWPREARLSVLEDYSIKSRQDLTAENIVEVTKRRAEYFSEQNRSFHVFFRKWEFLFEQVNPEWSYKRGTAVHVDLVACATRDRWQNVENKKTLLGNCSEHFARAVLEFPPGTLFICNGEYVRDLALKHFQHSDRVIAIPKPLSACENGDFEDCVRLLKEQVNALR